MFLVEAAEQRRHQCHMRYGMTPTQSVPSSSPNSLLSPCNDFFAFRRLIEKMEVKKVAGRQILPPRDAATVASMSGSKVDGSCCPKPVTNLLRLHGTWLGTTGPTLAEPAFGDSSLLTTGQERRRP